MLVPALTLLLLAGAPAVDDDRSPRTVVAEALERAAEGGADPVGLRDELLGLSGADLDELFAIHVAGDLGSGSLPPLDAVHAAAIEAALVRTAGLRPFLRGLAATATGVDERVHGLALLGRVAQREDVVLAADLAAAGRSGALVERVVQDAFARCLAATIARDADAARRLPNLARRVHPSLFRGVLDALATGAHAAPDVADLLGVSADLDPLVLATLARVGRGGRITLDDRHLRRLRSHLQPPGEATLRVLSAEVLAAAGDGEACGLLINLLEAGTDAERDAARAALERMTRQRLRYDVDAWRSWYAEETAWWRRRAEAVARDVATGSAAAAVDAICELSRQRLFPDRVVLAILPALERREAPVVQLALGALGQLDSELALPDLVACLDHPDADARYLAHEALVRRTGRRLPPDRNLWETRVLAPRATNDR